jgi:glutamate dehydrogenase
MASKTAPLKSVTTPTPRPARKLPPALVTALSARFEAALLPAEVADFHGPELAEAARFTLAAAMERDGDEPTVTIDSVLGEHRRFLRIALVNDDRPFLVDSIAATVAAQGLSIDRLVHPVMPVRRDDAGLLLEILPAPLPTARRESVIYLETDRADSRTRNALTAALTATLGDVQAAVTDWPRMQGAMLADAARVTDPDGAELLRWLAGGMFTQLGHVTRKRDGSQQGALGICRKSARRLLAPESYDRAFAWFDAALVEGRDAHAPLAIKANMIANVHRRVPLDLFIIPVIEGDAVIALSVHAGVWTSSALGSPPASVPRLSARQAALMEKLAINPQGHTGKALVHALTVLPHDLMISFADDDLERVATTMMSQVDRPRPRLLLVRAPLARHLFAFVWLPRDAIATRVRLQIAEMLSQATGAPVIDWSMTVEGSDLALLRFVLDIREGSSEPDEPALNLRLEAMVRGWTQAVEAELIRSEEPARAAAIAARYAEAFPGDYRASNGPAEAAHDITALRAITGRTRAARLLAGQDGEGLRLKLYQREGSIVLSDAVPVLENFGFRVLDERPTALGAELGTVHDFQLDPPVGVAGATVMARAAAVETALACVLNGAAEDDAFNRLIVASGLSAQEADWLRAWFRYLRQAGLGYGVATVVEALRNAGEVTAALIAAFSARHDPAFSGDRDAAWLDAQERVRLGLSHVAAINDDRLLRAFRALVDAILRTNAFAPAAHEALAFKLDSAMVPGLPRPLPWREIFVYSRRVEGIHLRAGPVARGGLRWSDRRDDFRTEVLGLMKAQRVKNAVIVPTGAKGGFYPKQLPDPTRDREGWLAEGKASYQVFICTLLSITDNIVEGKVVHPEAVVIRDGEDPYFVVAADKGTATFSDTANAIAESQDFWLDDAFASGGSKGYDHKAMGITAKGAWLSVQRHFLELGVDVQADRVRVVGVGDMSGDVFGNGMLLSKALKVVAAFDHRHIFLDPDPDPTASWSERARMFALPRSSWDDYDRSLISAGGGVFPRTMKAIPLSAEMRAALDISAAEMDPETLISAILRAPADLLWFGGIGTYVKAASENNATVGDPANDAVRVDAEQLRVRVIGEGANLGTTQAGRIAFSLAGPIGTDGRPTGGRINTDFIDNSAGVDCSDNEVNIKIALASAKRAGRLSERGRVSLLVGMTDAVAAHVLEDNRLQALALSIAERPRAAATASYSRLIDMLEEAGDLDRRTEGLADAEQLTRRAAEGHGLTRPELAVLLSSAKLVLQRALEDSAVVDDPGLAGELLCAFPEPMRGKFRKDILAHRLRREIIATRLANRLVNRMGMLHPFELAEEEGASPAQVAAAFVAAERLFNMDAVWHALETAAMPETARILLFDRAAAALSSHMADLLRVGAGTVPPTRLVAELAKPMDSLSDAVGTLLGVEPRAQSAALCDRLVAAGAPQAEAAMIAHLFNLDGAAGLAMLARDSGTAAPALTGAFIEVGVRLGLDWAQQTAERMAPSDPWERLLVHGLARDFQHMRLDFLRRVAKGRKDPVPAATRWLDTHAAAIEQFRALVGRARGASPVTPVMLAQLASQARGVLAK